MPVNDWHDQGHLKDGVRLATGEKTSHLLLVEWGQNLWTEQNGNYFKQLFEKSAEYTSWSEVWRYGSSEDKINS